MSTVHFTRRRTCVLAAPSLATLAALAAWPLAAWAAYPERPIKLVVPYPAGGFAQLARSSPLTELPEQQLRLLNGAYAGQPEPKPGQLVKVVQ